MSVLHLRNTSDVRRPLLN